MLRFDATPLPDSTRALRAEVRAFLAVEMAKRDPRLSAHTWSGYDEAFSRALGERGWIGMTWPKKYGGGERSALERYVVIEELLAAGAPVAAHWVADRQSGPQLLRFGTEAQRESILPGIVRGECHFCIGMSEPDSGSDLASIRTRAEKVDGGWRVNGTKIWTSGAHRCHYMILLARTGAKGEQRHAGLSQMLVDLKHTDGVEVRPIADLTGDRHFNEVVFRDALVPAGMLLGEEGQGWSQVMSELAFERSGPERLLSSFRLVAETLRLIGPQPDAHTARALGRIVAHLATLRRLSISVANLLQAGESPAVEAALVKDLGTGFEQEIPEILRTLVAVEPSLESDDVYAAMLAYIVTHAPSFTLRGGTREVLRGIIARGLGVR